VRLEHFRIQADANLAAFDVHGGARIRVGRGHARMDQAECHGVHVDVEATHSRAMARVMPITPAFAPE
jgi:hypothetical protein